MIEDPFLGEITGHWDYSSLPPNVQLGPNCFIERKESFASFRSERSVGLVLGARTKVFTWTTFNVEPTGRVQVGSDSILSGVTFMCKEEIEIGDQCVISHNVTIADSDFHPLDPEERMRDARANAPFGDRSQRPAIAARPVFIEDNVWIGIGAIILKGVKIGQGARIMAGSVVTKDVPKGGLLEGNPGRISAGGA